MKKETAVVRVGTWINEQCSNLIYMYSKNIATYTNYETDGEWGVKTKLSKWQINPG